MKQTEFFQLPEFDIDTVKGITANENTLEKHHSNSVSSLPEQEIYFQIED